MFMKPQIVKGCFVREEEGDWCPEEYAGFEPEERSDGFFARLSAPGYMDCTYWNGPYETAAEAAAELYSMYGDEGDEGDEGEWRSFLAACGVTP